MTLHSETDSTSSDEGTGRIGAFHPHQLRLFPPKESLDSILERLIRNKDYEKMLSFLKVHRDMINRIPNNRGESPLEAVLTAKDTKIAKELLALGGGYVRPEYRILLKHVM